MEISLETNKKVQELQMLEQDLQRVLMQKQSLEIEMNEAGNALTELLKTGDEVYKILGGIMIKSDKKSLKSELEEKKKILEIKIQSLEKQEKNLDEKSDSLRLEIQKSINSN